MQSPHSNLITRTGQEETEPDLLQTRTIERIPQQALSRFSHLPRDTPDPAPIPIGVCTAGIIIAGDHPSIYSTSSPIYKQSQLKQIQFKHAQSRRSVSEAERMASSSSRPLTVEERLKQLDDKLEKLKNMLQFQLDFLENLDSEAGRRMEQLEQDLSFVKIGFSEELDKLQQELQNPQERFADRIGELEDKLSKMNLEWGENSEK
jgi:hypothetical protein